MTNENATDERPTFRLDTGITEFPKRLNEDGGLNPDYWTLRIQNEAGEFIHFIEEPVIVITNIHDSEQKVYALWPWEVSQRLETEGKPDNRVHHHNKEPNSNPRPA